MPAGPTPVGRVAFVCAVFLLSGVVSSLTSKTLFQKNYPAYCTDEDHPFSKPFFMVMTMFIGEMLCLPLFYFLQYLEKRKRAGEQAQNYEQLTDFDAPHNIVESPDQSKGNGNGVHLGGPVASRPPLYFFLILSTFDLVASSCVTVGQVWIAASVAQMLRGSMVVFTAFFSWLLLARRYNIHQVGGMGSVVAGLIVVGVSSILNGSDTKYSSTQVAMGIVLSVVGSLLNSIQNVVEERLLKADQYVVQPMEVVGWEGVFGLINSAFILLPIVAHVPADDSAWENCGVAEDTIDSLHMLSYNAEVVIFNILYIFGIMLLNWTANIISLYLSATHRNLINATRTIIVWIVSLFLYYEVDEQVGEQWTTYSPVQLAGFILLISGTLYFSHASQRKSEAEKQKNLAAQLLVDDSLHNGIHVQNETN